MSKVTKKQRARVMAEIRRYLPSDMRDNAYVFRVMWHMGSVEELANDNTWGEVDVIEAHEAEMSINEDRFIVTYDDDDGIDDLMRAAEELGINLDDNVQVNA